MNWTEWHFPEELRQRLPTFCVKYSYCVKVWKNYRIMHNMVNLMILVLLVTLVLTLVHGIAGCWMVWSALILSPLWENVKVMGVQPTTTNWSYTLCISLAPEFMCVHCTFYRDNFQYLYLPAYNSQHGSNCHMWPTQGTGERGLLTIWTACIQFLTKSLYKGFGTASCL